MTFNDVTALATKASGREVERITLDDKEWIAAKVPAGTPEAMARTTHSPPSSPPATAVAGGAGGPGTTTAPPR
ncbi:hypothetical protein ABZ825_40640 [Streptomyces tauricus]|uniref:hypothetical protein n=1 Tax=Streptomyces tauricus TaxID=68274 RepID=UPI0033D48A0E